MARGYRTQVPNKGWEDSVKMLTWDQIPVVLDNQVTYGAVIPRMSPYSKQVLDGVRSFRDQLDYNTEREFTLSGVGSFIDDQYGHNLKRPTHPSVGSACSGNSLCIEPTCFGFTEGVIESNNTLRNYCWSLDLPCLKDLYYTDRNFEKKLGNYFAMFFSTPPSVLSAHIRGELLRHSIKVTASKTNVRYTGGIGGNAGVSLPFYIDPEDPTVFPLESSIPGGIAAANLAAFVRYLAPRLFSGSFAKGMQSVNMYGLDIDYDMAKEQTASVIDSYMDAEIIRAIRMYGGASAVGEDKIEMLLGGGFSHDPMFPTFGTQVDGGQILPITQEILEDSTIAGFVQTDNPEHSLAEIRGILFVPNTWKYTLVEPPRDDFSSLGLGNSLNFKLNSPGVNVLISSSMFTRNKVGGDKTFWVGQAALTDGRVGLQAQGTMPRERALREAVRTELVLTYAAQSCGADGALKNTGAAAVQQSLADGFALKSKIYIGSDVRGTVRPVLYLFKVDTPRSAQAVEVCDVEEIDVAGEMKDLEIVNCGPGGQDFIVLTFNQDADYYYTADDDVAWKTGPRGSTYFGVVSSVSGRVVVVTANEGQGPLPCCPGASDAYGTQGELINLTTASASSSEIAKFSCEDGVLTLELFDPIIASLNNAAATITLPTGQVIDVLTVGAGEGIIVAVDAAVGEACDLCTADCACLDGAVFALDLP